MFDNVSKCHCVIYTSLCASTKTARLFFQRMQVNASLQVHVKQTAAAPDCILYSCDTDPPSGRQMLARSLQGLSYREQWQGKHWVDVYEARSSSLTVLVGSWHTAYSCQVHSKLILSQSPRSFNTERFTVCHLQGRDRRVASHTWSRRRRT